VWCSVGGLGRDMFRRFQVRQQQCRMADATAELACVSEAQQARGLAVAGTEMATETRWARTARLNGQCRYRRQTEQLRQKYHGWGYAVMVAWGEEAETDSVCICRGLAHGSSHHQSRLGATCPTGEGSPMQVGSLQGHFKDSSSPIVLSHSACRTSSPCTPSFTDAKPPWAGSV
jgi:hypothetical protein